MLNVLAGYDRLDIASVEHPTESQLLAGAFYFAASGALDCGRIWRLLSAAAALAKSTKISRRP